ncbi:MAG TPA: type III pantothenate kinase [Anaerolineae bacterium]
MLLAIKIGNTNVGLALCAVDAHWLGHWRAQSRPDSTADEYAALVEGFFESSRFSPRTVTAAIIVSVVPALTQTLVQMCREHFGVVPLLVTSDCNLGLRIVYDDPRSLGMDRLVPCVAAKAKYGVPALVVDFGTATTFNALNRDGDFVGGAIAPGMNMIADALHLFTARLPRVDIAAPSQVIATNTNDGLRAGVFYGYLSLIEGLARRTLDEMNTPTAPVIATGGLARIVAPHIPLIHAVDMELPYEGLRLIHELNKDQENHNK